jgi:hypothetical protein
MLRRRITADRFVTLPAYQADYYEEQADGTYLLQIIEPDGSLAPPPSATEDVSGLKSAFEKAKAERDDTRNQLRDVRAALASDDSTGAYRALLEKRLADLTAREATNQAEHEAARAALAAVWEPKIAECDAKLQSELSKADDLILSRELSHTIRAARGIEQFLEPRLRKFCRIQRDEDGNRTVVVHDDLGNIRTDPTTGQPVSLETALAELKAFDPVLARLAFEPPISNGNGAAPH